jgi:hypothetical protein
MVFTTHRDGSSLVATWEPEHGRLAMIIDGRVAMKARHLRTNKAAQFAWSRNETRELAVRVRGLAGDLAGMLGVIVGDRGFDAVLDTPVVTDLGGWECSSCGAPMITPLAPGTIQKLECPPCVGRRATAERGRIARTIVLAEDRITRAIAKEPMISRQTQAEVDRATAKLRWLSTHLSSVGAAPAGSDTDGSRP